MSYFDENGEMQSLSEPTIFALSDSDGDEGLTASSQLVPQALPRDAFGLF